MPRNRKVICTLDAETDPFMFNRSPKPFVWGFFNGETFAYFWGNDPETIAKELMDYLSDEEDLIIYAHNGGKFDFNFLHEYLDAELFMVNGRIAKATIFNGRIELRDSWMIIPIPLAQYDKDDIDYKKMEPEVRNLHKDEIIRYLRKDCTALHELCSAFHERFGNNISLASTALKQLKKTGYDVCTTYDSYDKKLRDFYFGGRVQCFQTGSFEGNFKYVDINSAYPFAMMQPHWYGSQMIEHLRLPEGENGSWFAKITAIPKGCLPMKHEGKLYFPDDEKPRTYYASGWEILAGVRTDTLRIMKVHTVYKPTTRRSFEEYVNYWFKEKAEAKAKGEKVRELFAKLMLNSCYGKFGQDGRKFEKFCIVELGDWPENDPKWSHDQRWQWFSDTETGHSVFSRADPSDKFYNVATAASVTGFVRAFLWESLQQADTPLYCDTDSIICRDFHGDIGKGLGQWDLEAELTEAHIAQRKMYACRVAPVTPVGPVDKVKIASKGVRLTYNHIKNGIKDGDIIRFEKDAPSFSFRFGERFTARKIDLKNIQKNVVNNPN